MSKQYSCDLCKNKKAPCITQKSISKMDNKTNLIGVFKSCLNMLRDCEGLTGEKALRNLS
jgi:hypothetical protein